MRIDREVAVVTGGASGIGRATALALARRGADIVLADINDTRLAAAVSEVQSVGRRALGVHCDVSRDEDIAQLADRAETELGPVSILMNNAGVVLRGALEQISVADWEWCVGINVMGVVRGIHAFLPRMMARHHGYIVNTGSVSGLVALTGEGAPYIASKFAVVGLTEALALYCRPFGIGVTLLCPGGVATHLAETSRSIGMTADREAAETRAAQTVQSGAELQPEDVAELVVKAVEDETFFVLTDSVHESLLRRRAADLNAFMASRFEAPHPPAPSP